MTKKTCTKCGIEKDFSEFSKDKSNKKDGLQSKCKVCVKVYYKEYKEELLLKQSFYKKTKKGKESRKKYNEKWRKSNTLKIKAHQAVQRALIAGILIKPTICEVCGKRNCKIEAHHDEGYSKPKQLVVQWVCKPCHDKIHEE